MYICRTSISLHVSQLGKYFLLKSWTHAFGINDNGLYNSGNLGIIGKIVRQKQSCPAQHTQFTAISFCRLLHKEAICPTCYRLQPHALYQVIMLSNSLTVEMNCVAPQMLYKMQQFQKQKYTFLIECIVLSLAYCLSDRNFIGELKTHEHSNLQNPSDQ